MDCMTNSDVLSCQGDYDADMYIYDSRPALESLCFPLDPRLAQQAASFNTFSQNFNDIKTSVWLLVICIVFTIIGSILLLFLTAFCVEPTFWVTVIASILILLGIGVYFVVEGIYYYFYAPDGKLASGNTTENLAVESWWVSFLLLLLNLY